MEEPSTFSCLAAALGRALAGKLPGREAQLSMAPEGRELPPPENVAATARHAGVLVLLYPREEKPHLLLTRRTGTVAFHKNQVSLPGGTREAGETLLETALREAAEEIGIDRHEVRIIGTLTPLYIPVSGFLVSPFVGSLAAHPSFRPDPIEVAELIEVPIARLLDAAIVGRETWSSAGKPREVPFFSIGGHKVWGATAMVLAELRELLRRLDTRDRRIGRDDERAVKGPAAS
ncbi:MAG: CoA pyrophosphatase [Planctomycetota bacterium]